MTVLADLPNPPPWPGLIYFIDDAFPSAPSPAGLVISTYVDYQAVPWATVAGLLLINKLNTGDMRTYLGLGSAAVENTSAFESSGSIAAAITAHLAASNPHPQYATNSVGSPTSRSLSLATAYQATTTSKPAVVTVNLNSTAGLTLTTGATNTAQIVIGSTNAVASGTGTVIGNYSNSLTGTLVVGLAINTASASPITFVLPANWYFAVRQTSGTVSITSAFDQQIG